jgi:hypothetical protein
MPDTRISSTSLSSSPDASGLLLDSYRNQRQRSTVTTQHQAEESKNISNTLASEVRMDVIFLKIYQIGDKPRPIAIATANRPKNSVLS